MNSPTTEDVWKSVDQALHAWVESPNQNTRSEAALLLLQHPEIASETLVWILEQVRLGTLDIPPSELAELGMLLEAQSGNGGTKSTPSALGLAGLRLQAIGVSLVGDHEAFDAVTSRYARLEEMHGDPLFSLIAALDRGHHCLRHQDNINAASSFQYIVDHTELGLFQELREQAAMGLGQVSEHRAQAIALLEESIGFRSIRAECDDETVMGLWMAIAMTARAAIGEILENDSIPDAKRLSDKSLEEWRELAETAEYQVTTIHCALERQAESASIP